MTFKERLTENNDFCTGCSACCSICPTDALKLTQDQYGYWKSSFNENNCINCGKCENLCPILYPVHIDRYQPPKAFAIQMEDDIRLKCSSGGVFLYVANSFIKENGVVIGCRWDDNNRAIHVLVNNYKDLEALCGSKYVQSYMDDIFNNVEKELKKGKKVLFSGTPCQVAGLYAFLGKVYDNLYTIDLLCFYAPSPLMLKNYLDETYPSDKIMSISFRDKKNGWTSEKMSITTLNNTGTLTHHVRENGVDAYQTAFHRRIMMGEHCENCAFVKLPRVGDLTLGDYWHLEKHNPNFNDGKGTSAVLINSEKGFNILDSLKRNSVKFAKINLSYLKGNRFEISSVVERDRYNKRFYQHYDGIHFVKPAQDAIDKHYDVAIVGGWDVKNYGSHLTYYSLHKIIEMIGYSSLLIGCPKNAQYKSTGNSALFKKNPYEEWDICYQYETVADMIEANNYTDTFIVGSDQLWNNELYKYFGEFTLLDFVFDNKKKIAYSTSFGKAKWEGSSPELEYFANHLKRFDAISVREESGVNICKELFDVDATWCIDPIFLCDRKEYDKISEASDKTLPDRYLAAYILDYKPEIESAILKISKRLKIPYVVVTDPNLSQQKWSIQAHMDYSEEDWITFIKNSEYFITDSFHGMCIALIYNKKISIIVNQRRGADRFYDYAKRFNISTRLVEDPSCLINEYYDLEGPTYDRINQLIDQYREEGIAWIKKNLTTIKKNAELTDNDIARIHYLNKKKKKNPQTVSLNRFKKEDIGVQLKGLLKRFWENSIKH